MKTGVPLGFFFVITAPRVMASYNPYLLVGLPAATTFLFDIAFVSLLCMLYQGRPGAGNHLAKVAGQIVRRVREVKDSVRHSDQQNHHSNGGGEPQHRSSAEDRENTKFGTRPGDSLSKMQERDPPTPPLAKKKKGGATGI